MSKIRTVLKNRNFFLLWLGQIISQLGDRLGQMALIGFVYLKAPGSSLEIAKVLSFTIIPVFVIGPVAGAYVDRWDRRRTLYLCDLLRMLLVLLIPLFLFAKGSALLLYGLIFLTFSAGRFFIPAKLSIIPELVKEEELLVANSLINITGMIAAVLGFGIAGMVVEWLGPQGGFYLDAVSFLLSAVLIFFIATGKAIKIKIKGFASEIVEVIRKSLLEEIRDGVIYFIRQKEIRFTAGVMFLLWSGLGAIYVVLIVFVQKTLGSGTKDLGFLIAFLGLGLFLGSLIYGKFGQKLSHYKAIFSSLILSGITLGLFSLALSAFPHFFIAAGLTFIQGIIISPIMIASTTLIHKASDNQMLGKIFSSLEIVMHLAFLLFMFISSFLAERFPAGIILLVVSGVFVVLGMLNLVYHRKIPWLD